MANSDSIFLAADEPLSQTVDWLAGVLGLQRLEDPELKADEHFFRGRARSLDREVVFVVEPNIYGEADPEPEDVSAIDRYTGVVEVRLLRATDEESRAREARAVFDALAEKQSEVALVLSHAMSWIVAAYLPGAGVCTFPSRTSLDVEDIETWRPWVVER